MSKVAVCLMLAHAVASMFNTNQVCEPKADICKSAKRGAKTVLAPKRKYKVWANGCGTDSIGFQLMGDEHLDFTDCCNWHDACYGICGISKNLCEKRFSKCMKDKCALEPTAELKKSCETTAELYAMGPNMMGCPAFTAGQKEACECVDAAKADKHNRDRLDHFLAHQAKGGAAEDTEGLLAKYKGKEPVMFLRLLNKYPEALTHKKPRVTDQDKIFESIKKQKRQETPPVDDNNDVEAHIEL